MTERSVPVTLLLVATASPHVLPGVAFSPPERRVRLLDEYRVDLVIDVGANSGQYAAGLRAAGYHGRIVSFEPLCEPYRRLAASCAHDRAWACRRLALGSTRDTLRMNVSEDSRNSSVFTVGDRHLRAVPDSRTIAVERVEMHRLDAIWSDVVGEAHRPYLIAVYNTGPLFRDVVGFLGEHKFEPIAFEGVLDDHETGEMLQADGIFRRGTRSDLVSRDIQ
jgi:FkbM family methyltransferase